ncbi:MAG: CPBP family intramembrane metalloprotease [Acidimicrobiales bacterium]|nr:CPBP family intramembrane metalloprotease [Acidimicrobiales bacterium]
MGSARSWWPIWVIVTALAVVNVASNEWVPRAGYVPFAVAAAVLVIGAGVLLDGLDLEAFGFGRRQLGKGLRWGGTVGGVVAVVMLVGVAVPSTRELFEDRRVESMTFPGVLYAAFVRVPFGTVLLEEVAFRAVLPEMLAQRVSRRVAIGSAAVLFGLWHVLPSLGIATVNPVASDTIGGLPDWVVVCGSVLSTALVGVWFSFLRERSGSIIAPMLAHWSSNALGYLFAYAVISR